MSCGAEYAPFESHEASTRQEWYRAASDARTMLRLDIPRGATARAWAACRMPRPAAQTTASKPGHQGPVSLAGDGALPAGAFRRGHRAGARRVQGRTRRDDHGRSVSKRKESFTKTSLSLIHAQAGTLVVPLFHGKAKAGTTTRSFIKLPGLPGAPGKRSCTWPAARAARAPERSPHPSPPGIRPEALADEDVLENSRERTTPSTHVTLNSRILSAIAASVVMGFGCKPDGMLAPPAGLPYAIASRSCSPTDGPAVSIVLVAERTHPLGLGVPFLNLQLWRPLEAIRGRAFSLTAPSVDGAASFHRDGTTYEAASSAVVRVTDVAADGSIEGTVDAVFPSSGRIRGSFRGVWIPGVSMCG